MAPKRTPKKQRERFRCDQLDGERFHAQTDDIFRYNWWEIFCFPYILCSRVWDCCISLCSGSNQCLVYWMLIQWLVCKITKITTPNPILFPYYFYLFCQVILLTIAFILLWQWIGRSVLIPYILQFYETLQDSEQTLLNSTRKNITLQRMSFRRYCFRKGEIFETSFNKEEMKAASFGIRMSGSTGLFMLETFFYNLLNQ